MSQDRLIKLACKKCKRINYWSSKNKKLVERKIKISKHCKWCKVHTEHNEVKKEWAQTRASAKEPLALCV